MKDWLNLYDFFFYKLHHLMVWLTEGTFLESSGADIGFFLATLIMCLITFGGIMSSMFVILWIERKFYARVNDRRGATTALRSLWVGENGVTAGQWWNMVPFGLGKPIGALNGWLNRVAGNDGHSHEMVNRVGNRSWYGVTIFPGFFQNLADGMKFMIKEHMVPERADKVIFEVAPFLVISSTIMILGLVPLSSGIYGANPELSVLFAFAIFGIAPLGVFFAGWSSNNKYTLLGGIRSAAQLTAYEIPLLLSILSVCIMAGSFNFLEIVHFQHSAGVWLLFLMPLGAVLYLVSMIAEVERIPFDMPEAEAELVEGWWTEYGGMRFGLLFAAEYMRVYAACILFAHFFLGGWASPFAGLVPGGPLIPGIVWTLLKAWFIFTVIFVWARTALPRIRTDQILEFGWRMLLPLSFLQVVLAVIYRLYLFDASALADTTSGGWAWDFMGIPWGVPILTTAFWVGVFWVFMNDENLEEDQERMFHVQTLTPAGKHTAGQE
jgi:NADH-quinone oxidoreductase subunit H